MSGNASKQKSEDTCLSLRLLRSFSAERGAELTLLNVLTGCRRTPAWRAVRDYDKDEAKLERVYGDHIVRLTDDES
jgi:hypothetical protein